MPELPDIELYLHALRPRVLDTTLERIRIGNPFIIRTYDPPADAITGKRITDLRRLGKRVVFAF